jgi:hypothetical protein
MRTDETNPQDWFLLAKDRLEAADAVRQACGAGASAIRNSKRLLICVKS